MSPLLGSSLRDLIADVRPAVAGARSRLANRRALARRSAMLPAVLGALRAVGLVSATDWTVRGMRWSDTDVVIVPIGPRDAPTQLIVKLAESGPALEALEAQRLHLDSLYADPRLESWVALAPRVLHSGTVEAIPYFVETAQPGVQASGLLGDPAVRGRLLLMAAETIAELHARTGVPAVVDDALLDDWVATPLEAIATALRRRGGVAGDMSDVGGALAGLETELREALAGREVTIGWIHGDYWPPNILAAPDGSRITGIVDWDLSSGTQLAMHDPVHLIADTRRLITGREFGHVVRELVAGGQLSADEQAALAAAGIQPAAWTRDHREMVVLTWLRGVGHFAPTDGRSPRWLRHNVLAVLEVLTRSRPSRNAP